MKNFINHRTMRLLVCLLFAFFSSLTVCAQKFGTHQVFLSDDGSASKRIAKIINTIIGGDKNEKI